MIGIYTIGNIDSQLIDKLIVNLQEFFLDKFSPIFNLPLPSNSYNILRRKYFTTFLLKYINNNKGNFKYTLAILNKPIYSNISNNVFEDYDTENNIALITLDGLYNKELGIEENEKILLERLLKRSIHALSHLYGLNHCTNKNCVMYDAKELAQLDYVNPFYCNLCEKKLRVLEHNKKIK